MFDVLLWVGFFHSPTHRVSAVTTTLVTLVTAALVDPAPREPGRRNAGLARSRSAGGRRMREGAEALGHLRVGGRALAFGVLSSVVFAVVRVAVGGMRGVRLLDDAL